MVAGRESRQALERQRDFLLRSVEDLDAEHAAGDVDDADYAALRGEYVARAATTLRELEHQDPDDVERSKERQGRVAALRRYLGRRRVRRVLVVASVCCLIGVVTVAALSLAGVRLPGEGATGSVSLPKAAQIHDDLAEATLAAGTGNEVQAVALYDEVLALDPRQAEALAYRGWVVRLAGLDAHSPRAVRLGDRSIARAVAVDSGYPPARAFDAIARFEDRHEIAAALADVTALLRHHPSTALLAAVGHRLVAIEKAAHRPIPGPLARYVKGAASPAASGRRHRS